jgi:hypothetical protein
MVRSKDQVGCQVAIERPEEELDTLRIHGLGSHRLIWLEDAGESRAEEIKIILLKAPPDTNILVQILGKLHKNMRQYPAF